MIDMSQESMTFSTLDETAYILAILSQHKVIPKTIFSQCTLDMNKFH